jgi:hypothetical protein
MSFRFNIRFKKYIKNLFALSITRPWEVGSENQTNKFFIQIVKKVDSLQMSTNKKNIVARIVSKIELEP